MSKTQKPKNLTDLQLAISKAIEIANEVAKDLKLGSQLRLETEVKDLLVSARFSTIKIRKRGWWNE